MRVPPSGLKVKAQVRPIPLGTAWQVTAGSCHCNIFQLKAKPTVSVVLGFPFDVVFENTTNH